MITITPEDAIHKAWLYRVLISIVDNNYLQQLYFKGGTCAAMCGFLDRFSIDLDFDYLGNLENLPRVKQELRKIFKSLELEIKDESVNALQFFLKYKNKNPNVRNTLKVDVNFPAPKANEYEPIALVDIGRVVVCQNKPTMFANKLVAIIDRFERNHSIAGRDIYDIHHFFVSGYGYNGKVIAERTMLTPLDFFKKLRIFINENINDKILSQDLNSLIPYERFKILRKTLKVETLMFIDEEINRLKKGTI